MNIIKYNKIFLSVSGILTLVGITAIIVFGFKPGIDFVGGTMWQIQTPVGQQLTTEDVKNFFGNDLGEKNITIFPSDNNSFLIRLGHIPESEHQQYLQALKLKFNIEEVRFNGIGPTVGKELKNKAFWAITMVLLGISLYIAFAFRKVSYPIKSWKYGIITLITLFHDILIPAGMLAVLGKFFGIETDTNFVVALLVIMGFSVHDTIVVFDRIRENLLVGRGRLNLSETINQSINQTIARSINTSLTLILVLIVLFFFGPAVLKYFILTILVGVVIGTYSSIFVASPLLLYIGSSKSSH
jgi:preprotein translocase subunit SecF